MLRAQKMLLDARCALAMLEEEEDAQRRRVLWVSCITLTRGIGHVLQKVDANEDDSLRNAVDKWWEQLKQEKGNSPHIFWDFIDLERNNTLKEYDLSFDDSGGPIWVIVEDDNMDEPFDISDFYVPIANKNYEGEDIRDVLSEALDWWETQLSFLSQIEK